NIFKFGTNRLVKISLAILYWLGMWPRNNSTVIYTIVGYTFQGLTIVAWNIAKCIAAVMLEHKSELVLYAPACVYSMTSVYRGLIIMWKYKAIDTSLNAISDF